MVAPKRRKVPTPLQGGAQQSTRRRVRRHMELRVQCSPLGGLGGASIDGLDPTLCLVHPSTLAQLDGSGGAGVGVRTLVALWRPRHSSPVEVGGSEDASDKKKNKSTKESTEMSKVKTVKTMKTRDDKSDIRWYSPVHIPSLHSIYQLVL